MDDSLKKKLYVLAGVIIFVGICISVVVLTSTMSRTTTRDVVRIAHMREVRAGFSMFFNTKGTYALKSQAGACVAGAALSACDDQEVSQFIQLGAYNDPSGTQVCYNGVAKSCNYSFGISPDKDKYEVCFYLEKGIKDSELPVPGLYKITEKGFEQGCSLTPQGQ